jgi:hypothetical protein
MKIELDTDFRQWPLVSDRPDAIRGYAREMRDHGHHGAADLLEVIADKIAAQSRIPEPGLWGVVEADWKNSAGLNGVVRWVRHTEDRWISHPGYFASWDDLIDPVLVREGVTE